MISLSKTILLQFISLLLLGNAILAQEGIDERTASFKEVRRELMRRSDLIYAMVSVVREAKQVDTSLINTALNDRKDAVYATNTIQLEDPGSIKSVCMKQQKLMGSFARIMVAVENYPSLKSSSHVKNLMKLIEQTEVRLKAAISNYNQAGQKADKASLAYQCE